MATLIICPVCDTRYETAAVFPPEGRKVRCSKCTHVWQAMPVTTSAEPAVVAAPALGATVAAPPKAPPPAPPKQAPTVNTAMRGFAGIAQPPPPEPSLSERLAQAESDAEFAGEQDLATQAAHFNDEAVAAAPPVKEKSGGIFARLASKRPAAAPAAPPAPAPARAAAPAEAAMADATMGDVTMGDAGMGDAGMTDPALADTALVEAAMAGLDGDALPAKRRERKKPPVVAIGWAVLALIIAIVVGLFVLAPATVMSVLPGASRLYGLLGMPVGAHGLSFEGVRYGWTSDGGQPVLEVQGDVVNITSGALDVPTVVIALRDESGEEISEWTTEVGEPELAAGEHAPFLRQIPSPPSNVRSVKVRFAKAN
jgi:predicted Zn finger-like uncharacterized protein